MCLCMMATDLQVRWLRSIANDVGDHGISTLSAHVARFIISPVHMCQVGLWVILSFDIRLCCCTESWHSSRKVLEITPSLLHLNSKKKAMPKSQEATFMRRNRNFYSLPCACLDWWSAPLESWPHLEPSSCFLSTSILMQESFHSERMVSTQSFTESRICTSSSVLDFYKIHFGDQPNSIRWPLLDS